MTVVSIVRAENVPEAVREAVELAGGFEINEGDTVVIKPNAKNQARPGYGIVTDVAVIEPLVEMSIEKGAKKVTIADGAAYPTGSYHTFSAFETMGVTKLAKKWDLDLVDLNSYDSVDLEVPEGLVLDNVRVGRAVTEVDFLINVPVLKTHRGTLLSNCVKNIGVGVACREEKKRLHRLGIDEGLLDVFSVVKPHFNVVDALVCIEGDGPNFPPGKPRPLGLVLAGEDGVAVDAVCARLIGLDPLEVKHLRLAHDRGIGIADLGQIEVVGERLEDVATIFERPSTFMD
ncbi:MAG: DUF362 domain-containing protein [Candidatus Bathyarchaeota archaeon]|nr:DUF362 domain-containing protein [Candidatus Bathyarchaeota archaeon]